MPDYYSDRERDWERGRRYRGQGFYGPERERERDFARRGDDRGFFDRAGYMGGRPEWSGSGGYEPSGYGFSPPGWSAPERGGRHEYDAERWNRWVRGGAQSGPHAGRGPRGYQRSDERIREDVCERMCQSGDLDASDIEVRVSNAEEIGRAHV